MRKGLGVFATGALLFGVASGATAAILPVTASLDLFIGTLGSFALAGSHPGASSVGGGIATLPANSLSGVHQSPISPPLLTLLDGIGVAFPGIAAGANFAANASPALNNPLNWTGAGGTMSLNASAYLLMGGGVAGAIPLAVVGVGGTQMFGLGFGLLTAPIFANPYQLGMITLMGSLNGAPHTAMGTGVDNRTVGGKGTLVLVTPTLFDLGGPLGALASVATLTLTYTPEPGTLILVGLGAVGLAAAAKRKQVARSRAQSGG